MNVRPIFETLERPPSIKNATERPPEGHTPETSHYLRTQFLRRVAHDIASPTGITTTVLEELAQESRRPELVAMARRGLRRLLRLSEQLAFAAELEAGALSPDTTLEDVRVLTKDALDHALGIDGRRDVTAACEVPEDKLVVNVDRRLVGAALREVIGNALRLTSSRVAVDVKRTDSNVVIRVQDDGPGFSNEDLHTFGQRFTPRSTLRGLGLSLSMAKDVLAAHRGELSVETSSLPPGRRGGCGAAVLVTLPLA
jgi:signal transduction histidine kinase